MSKVLSTRVEKDVYDRVNEYTARWKITKQDLLYSVLIDAMRKWEQKALGITVLCKRPKMYQRK